MSKFISLFIFSLPLICIAQVGGYFNSVGSVGSSQNWNGPVGVYNYGMSSSISQKDQLLLESAAKKINDNLTLTEVEKSELEKGGYLSTKSYMLINEISRQAINVDNKPDFYSDSYTALIKAIIPEGDFDNIQNYVNTPTPKSRRKRQSYRPLDGFSKMKNQQLIYGYMQHQMSAWSPQTGTNRNINNIEFNNARVESLTLQLGQNDLKPMIDSMFKDDLIILSAKDLPYDNFFIMNYLRSYLKTYKKMNQDEIDKFIENKVISPYISDLIDDYTKDGSLNNGTSYLLTDALNNEHKWNYFRSKVQANQDFQVSNNLYERVRTDAVSNCSFKPREFENRSMLDDIKSISNLALSDNVNLNSKCRDQLDNFYQIGSNVHELRSLLRSRNHAGSEDDYSSYEERYYTEQNNLALSIGEFLELGCEFKEGNNDFLNFASKITNSLSSSASALGLSENFSLLAATISATTELTSSIMKFFKGESDLESGNRIIENLNDRHNFLDQMCVFKNYVYELDNYIFGNYDKMVIYNRAIQENKTTISTIEDEISCIEQTTQSSEVLNLINQVKAIDLSSFKNCMDFMKPFYNPKAKIRSSQVFYELYYKNCRGDVRKGFCDDFDDLKLISEEFKSAGTFCNDSDNRSLLTSVFDVMKDNIAEDLLSKNISRNLSSLRSLQNHLSRLRQKNSSFENDMSKLSIPQMTEDIKTYVEKTGNALFSGDKNSPMVKFFNDSRSAINDIRSQYENKVESIFDNDLSLMQRCDKAKSISNDITTYQERIQYVKSFCSSFQISSRVPFKSSNFSTNSFIKPEIKNGLDSQCNSFKSDFSNSSSDLFVKAQTFLGQNCFSNTGFPPSI